MNYVNMLVITICFRELILFQPEHSLLVVSCYSSPVDSDSDSDSALVSVEELLLSVRITSLRLD